MNRQFVIDQISSLSLSMFRKDFFGIYHGSVSAKLDRNLFMINTSNAIFDAIGKKSLIELNYKKDYRWKDASIDANIHYQIYKNISDAKFISFTMPPFTTAYSLSHNVIQPADYFGYNDLKSIEIYDPSNFEDWYDRADTEIMKALVKGKKNMIVIRGYGVYAYHRDINEMAKRVAILEKSCRLLMLSEGAAVHDFGI